MKRNLCIVLCFTVFLQLGICYDIVRVLSRLNEEADKFTDSVSQLLEKFQESDDDDAAYQTPPTPNNPAYHVALPELPACGTSDIDLPKVINGVPAKLGQLPWMALVQYKIKESKLYLCGGSLVSSRHVLTAAHCIHPKIEQYLSVVRLGELDYSRTDEGATPMDLGVVEKIRHEEYRKSKGNDIALLVLEKEVTFTNLIKPICLPRSLDYRKMDFVNYRPFVAGWGRTKPDGKPSPLLQMLQLKVLKNEDCRDTYPKYYTIDERVMCAGYKKDTKDTCKGDSGGPLMQPVNDVMYQTGVVSFGLAECGNGPAVYTRVTHYIPWIEEKITGKAGQ